MQGCIITFYSYKGGTGRSMALANTAWILASHGLRVLVVDWDLEAPGLHRYFHPFLPDSELHSSPGVIDLMWEFAAAAADPAPKEDRQWYTQLARVDQYAMSLEHPFPGKGTIDLMPAGRQDAIYSTQVTTFDWNHFYEHLGGGPFLEALRQSMRSDYDYVLIDSRTGLSDTAGVCTVQLPDTLVNCFSLSTQSVEGASAVAASVYRQRKDGLRIFPVPMRVEDGELDKLEASRDFARRKFDRFLSHVADPERYWGDVEVPYKSYYAYEEILATIGDRPRLENTILAAMERFVGHLTDQRVAGLAPITPESERRELLLRFQRSESSTRAGRRARDWQTRPRVFVCYTYTTSEHFDSVRELWHLLRSEGVDARLDLPPTQRGTDWVQRRAEQLEAADLVLVVASPDRAASAENELGNEPQNETTSLKRDYLRAPARYVAVRLPDCPEGGLPKFLSGRRGDHLSVDELTAEGIGSLVDVIAQRIRRESSLRGDVPERRPRWMRLETASSVVAEALRALRQDAEQRLQERLAIHGLNSTVALPVHWRVASDRFVQRGSVELASPSGATADFGEVLSQLPRGRLVIVGPPGSGKSVAAAVMTRTLLELGSADDGLPVPVWIPLADWDPSSERFQDRFSRLLTDRLRSTISRGAAYGLALEGRVIPIADGLDELSPALRARALSVLNRELREHMPIVLTCRIEEYAETVANFPPLHDAAVLELCPPLLETVIAYVTANEVSAEKRWKPVFTALRAQRPASLVEVFESPLMIRLAVEICSASSRDPSALLELAERGELKAELLRSLIRARYGPASTDHSAEKWFAFLAYELGRSDTRSLYWWRTWRDTPTRALQIMIASYLLLAVGAGITPLLALSDTLSRTVIQWAVVGAIVSVGVSIIWTNRPVAAKARRYELRRARRSLRSIPGFLPARVTPEDAPNPPELLRASRHGTLISLILAPVITLASMLAAIPLIHGVSRALLHGAELGGAIAILTTGVSLATSAWIRFGVARIALSLTERLPLRTLGFLEDARRKGLLRYSGAAYQFSLPEHQDVLARERASKRRGNS